MITARYVRMQNNEMVMAPINLLRISSIFNKKINMTKRLNCEANHTYIVKQATPEGARD
jgi:aspartyl-tRNA synthetase